MNSCVCGMKPPERPNDDCERCQLIVANQHAADLLSSINSLSAIALGHVRRCECAYAAERLQEILNLTHR